jgi:hypothetical protein
MTSKDVDDVLDRAASSAAPGDADAAAERAKQTILGSLTPVRPMAPAWVFAVAFAILFAVVAIAGGRMLGMYGLHALSGVERAIIFPVVIAAAALAGLAGAREMRPAGGRRIAGWAFAGAAIALLTAFAMLFHDYSMDRFVKQGVSCLRAGLLFAVAGAVLMSLVFVRGYVLNPRAAGVAAGTLAGLAGIGALELHCPNLKGTHVMVWHLGVVVLSGLAGLLIGSVFAKLRR